MSKLNDLSNSPLRKRFFETEFNPENNLAIASIRVSSKKQKIGHSITEQTEIIESYVEKNELELVNKWSVAESASKHERRKHFIEMIDYVRESQRTNRPIKHLIFSFQSRSNRNRDSARELEDLVDLGVTIHFARDNRKLTCMSDVAELMMWHMENIRNQSYIDELTKNSMGGILRKIEKGVYPGKPPFGYKSVGPKGAKYFVFDGDKAKYMQDAFRLAATGRYSDVMLKDELNKKYPQLEKTPGRKRFSILLRHPFYYGDFVYLEKVYKGDPDLHPPLISKKLWNEVQDVVNNKKSKRRISLYHPYVGLMKCSGKILDSDGNVTDEVCGCAVTAEKIKKKYKNGGEQEFRYYRCSNATKKCSQRDKTYMKKVVGRKVSYSQEEIEVLFEDIFKSFSFDDVTCGRMKKYLWDEHTESKCNNKKRVSELRNRLDEVSNYIDHAYEDKLAGKIDEAMWSRKNNNWVSEREKIEAELKNITDEKDEYMKVGVELIELMQHSEIIYKNAWF